MKRTRLDPYKDYPAELIDAIINSWIHSERDRKIIHCKLIDNWTYERIAEEFDMSSRRVQDIVYKAEDIVLYRLKQAIK